MLQGGGALQAVSECPGAARLVFFKHVIQIGFHQLDLNLDDFLVDSFDAKEEKKRKKIQHIKTVPAISRSSEIDEPAELNEPLRTPKICLHLKKILLDSTMNTDLLQQLDM